MNKKGIIVAIILLVVALGINCFVAAGNKEAKMDEKNLQIVTAPDQKEAQENEQFTIAEYVPEEIPGTNVARKGHCEANGYNDVYPATYANDGSPEGTSYWEGPAGEEAILTCDLKEAFNIHTIKMALNPMPIWAKRTQTMSISVSEDGENFKEILPSADYVFDPKAGNEVVVHIDEVKAKYVRLNITKNTGATSGQIAELEVYSNDK
ncbi:MAG: discoidin domain-containing protein [Lachnospiraceae bacterium]|nr:discoidin domain-containing protein [Lachnospiraceae bacterium]